jgi:hypothetical protein
VPIWSLPERGQRGPKPRHSRAAIAAVAVRIADAEGIDAVTMRRDADEVFESCVMRLVDGALAPG